LPNTASATTPGCAHISRHCAVCRTQPVLQHQVVRTSHDTVLYVEHSQCYNTRLCARLTTLCCMPNTASATTSGCAHISRHCAVCRTQPVLQQHQAMHTSHDIVLKSNTHTFSHTMNTTPFQTHTSTVVHSY